MTEEQLSPIETSRLVAFFGEAATGQILKNIGNLEGVFGEAARLIVMVMDGKIQPIEQLKTARKREEA